MQLKIENSFLAKIEFKFASLYFILLNYFKLFENFKLNLNFKGKVCKLTPFEIIEYTDNTQDWIGTLPSRKKGSVIRHSLKEQKGRQTLP